METTDNKLIRSIKIATIFSGLGMGLLLGIIMGLSASEVVQTIFGVLTALLGAFLGFDRRSFSGMEAEEYEKEKYNALYTGLRAGSFGIAVVVGILSGMYIRTQEVLTMSVEKRIKQWTDADFEPDYARKLVAYQMLSIDPQTGETGPLTEVQRITQGVLFNAAQRASLCGTIDPGSWNGDWQQAKKAMLDLDMDPVTELVKVIESDVPNAIRFDFLWGLRVLVCEMRPEKAFCKFGTDLQRWLKDNDTYTIAAEIAKLNIDSQRNVMRVLSDMVCQLEKD
jgi:hypothetical protein